MQAIVNETAPRHLPAGSLFEPINHDVTVKQITRAMRGFDAYDLVEILAAVRVVDNATGATSPAEEFILSLLRSYGASGGRLTFEEVEAEMEGFRENWTGLLNDTKRTAQRYPHLFSVVNSANADAPVSTAMEASSENAEPAEDAETKEDEPEPQTTAARLAARAFDKCIGRLTDQRSYMLEHQRDGLADIADDLAGATLLESIIQDWDDGGYNDLFPGEHGLLAAIRGNTEL